MPRTIAISDIHGCLAALETLLVAIRPQPADTLVLLGDYVDRGPHSRGVIERLLALRHECRLVPLLGNHDDMMVNIYDGHTEFYVDWLAFGGNTTLQSYGTFRPDRIPATHIDFLRNCSLYYETDHHFFLHGTYLADQPLDQQPREIVLWESLRACQPGQHCSGKMAIVGHTSQKSGEILDLGYLKCIDTRCYDQGWLTALDAETGQLWQANKQGGLRENAD